MCVEYRGNVGLINKWKIYFSSSCPASEWNKARKNLLINNYSLEFTCYHLSRSSCSSRFINWSKGYRVWIVILAINSWNVLLFLLIEYRAFIVVLNVLNLRQTTETNRVNQVWRCDNGTRAIIYRIPRLREWISPFWIRKFVPEIGFPCSTRYNIRLGSSVGILVITQVPHLSIDRSTPTFLVKPFLYDYTLPLPLLGEGNHRDDIISLSLNRFNLRKSNNRQAKPLNPRGEGKYRERVFSCRIFVLLLQNRRVYMLLELEFNYSFVFELNIFRKDNYRFF